MCTHICTLLHQHQYGPKEYGFRLYPVHHADKARRAHNWMTCPGVGKTSQCKHIGGTKALILNANLQVSDSAGVGAKQYKMFC